MIHGYLCNAKTFPLNCRYCDMRIFYFSCDHESKVFFEDLGPPWTIHTCQDQRTSADTTPSCNISIRGVAQYRGLNNNHGLLPGFRRANDSIDTAITRPAQESQSKYREAIRIEPLGTSPEPIVGIVQDRSVPNLSKRHDLPRNGIGYGDLANQIGDPDPVQITVLVDELSRDPAAMDYSSYTFLCSRKLLNRRIAKGVLVGALLEPMTPLAIPPIWVAREIERLH